ncbi:glycosyltransferase [Microbulbifer sp. SA54]|uniref:glycosyltransferase n=1 Tax=Microbulbifer sp. SA54 TaxID=3401577 RepID=UPI003AAF7DF3
MELTQVFPDSRAEKAKGPASASASPAPDLNNKTFKINHVMSSDIHSGIFSAILGYFEEYLPENYTQVVSKEPLPNCDVYHFHRPQLAQHIPKNSLCTVHHDLKDQDKWLSIDKFIQAYQLCSRVVCINKTQQRTLNDQFEIRNTTVIPHGVNKGIFSKPIHKPNSNIKTCLGLISKRYARGVKGEFRLYEIAKRLNPSEFSFFLVGEQRYLDAKKLANLGFDVQCFEDMPYSLIPQVYNRIDALLILSNFEGGPANIPEAIYSKTPIISTPVGMSIDVLNPEKLENGFFLDDDFDSAADQISAFRKKTKSFSFTNVPDWAQIIKMYQLEYERILEI